MKKSQKGADHPATEYPRAEDSATETPGTETVCEVVEEQDLYKDPVPPVEDPHLCTTQNARTIVTCTECRKPRMIYSHQKLSERQKISVTITVSEFDYTCGAPLLTPSNTSYKKVICRSTLHCGMNSSIIVAHLEGRISALIAVKRKLKYLLN